MSKSAKIYEKIMDGGSDANIHFDDLCFMLARMGFSHRTAGSHHIFTKNTYRPIVLQPHGKEAKVYQVRQVRKVLNQEENL